jgi:hypothetical protein
MKHSLVFPRSSCAHSAAKRVQDGCCKKARKFGLLFTLLALAVCIPFTSSAFGQIQGTIACEAGHGYWDVLSVMMMDPGLAANYHMEGITGGLPSAYVYTLWQPGQNKVFYTKNPQGNPWDVNLYDSNYIYQWVTELQTLNGVNHWNDPKSCRKFNNGSNTDTADYSMRWAARCATPGSRNSFFWNSPPVTQPNNTNYYTYVDETIQSQPQNLGYSALFLAHTETMEIYDHRVNPAKPLQITTLPLEYTYSCSVAKKLDSCASREVFDYGVDTTENPVDHIRHSYGWVRWRLYINATGGNPNLPAKWVLNSTTTTDNLMPGQVPVNFQCF